uniref:Thioredoxin domain-containing protein n=1 Tax=Romanomermis culicivorax TaxID=13658 RepID=A0A915JRJ8_ROMCU
MNDLFERPSSYYKGTTIDCQLIYFHLALAPIYEELATKLKSDPNIVIAKFDATANDLFEEYPVDGFPTIFFASSGNKRDPILYQDARNADALMKFLRKHAVKSFQKSEL